ncbi:hypothetical protein B0F87_104260 [Methylobacter tundripaludum]|uniref:Uncharacterized protein n=1 Tax=Methylobacter tundripaludum TaxID=173365 RepID=A0A2S6HFB1_9GAMM|nr:hypothetical protein B0F87_104260 [Methylobacter tundripaludum]
MLASKPSYCLGALSFPRAAWECIRDALRPVTPQPNCAAVLAHTRRSAPILHSHAARGNEE